jgi:hypothetical protein
MEQSFKQSTRVVQGSLWLYGGVSGLRRRDGGDVRFCSRIIPFGEATVCAAMCVSEFDDIVGTLIVRQNDAASCPRAPLVEQSFFNWERLLRRLTMKSWCLIVIVAGKCHWPRSQLHLSNGVRRRPGVRD